MNEKILLNALKVEGMETLSIKERGQLVSQIRAKTGYSYRKLQQLTGINHSTMQDWVTGRQIDRELHISVDRIIEYFIDYKPRLTEFTKIEKLIKILNKVIRVD